MNFPITHYEYICRTHGKHIPELVDNLMKGKPTDFMVFGDEILKIPDNEWFWGSVNENNIQLAVRMAYHMWRMRVNGNRIYYVPPHLCEMLFHTKLSIDVSFIQSPFEEIYLYVDQNELQISDYTGTRPIKGIYVNLHTESDGIRHLRFLATSGSEGIEENRDINYFACFSLPNHGTLEEAIDTQFKAYMENPDLNFKKDPTFQLSKVEDIVKFAVNILLYITSTNSDLVDVLPKQHHHKSLKKQRKYANKAQMSFIYVGQHIPKPKGSEHFAVGTKISHKFWVSGHWRGQWKGPKEIQHQERIWIQPYIKGPDLAEGISKKYIVRDET